MEQEKKGLFSQIIENPTVRRVALITALGSVLGFGGKAIHDKIKKDQAETNPKYREQNPAFKDYSKLMTRNNVPYYLHFPGHQYELPAAQLKFVDELTQKTFKAKPNPELVQRVIETIRLYGNPNDISGHAEKWTTRLTSLRKDLLIPKLAPHEKQAIKLQIEQASRVLHIITVLQNRGAQFYGPLHERLQQPVNFKGMIDRATYGPEGNLFGSKLRERISNQATVEKSRQLNNERKRNR